MAAESPGGALRLIDSPIAYMRKQALRPLQWSSALSAVAVHIIAAGAMGTIVTTRTSAAVGEALASIGQTAPDVPFALSFVVGIGTTAMIGIFVFLLHIGAVLGIDALSAQSGQYRRLVQLCALAYWPQVIWSASACIAVLFYFDPGEIRLSSTATAVDLQAEIGVYMENLARTPLQSTLTLTQQMFGVWLVALHAAALRVASGLSVGGAWAAGIVLAIMFVIGPAAAGFLW